MFMAPGEEIVVGNSISAAELMEQAKAKGMNVTGYGGGGAPQQGFGWSPWPVPGGASPASASRTGGHCRLARSGFAPPPVQPPQQGGGFASPPTLPHHRASRRVSDAPGEG